MEHVHPIVLPSGRLTNGSDDLSVGEFESLRSLVYKLAWVGKETRPEASGTASILAQHLKAPTLNDVRMANKMVKLLRSTTAQTMTIWKHDVDSFLFCLSERQWQHRC